jgi:hypothetical protein
MRSAGDILRYYYLWSHQADAGEQSGRKSRPVCLVVRTSANPATMFLFPITTKEPGAGRGFVPVSEIECRRGGLDFPVWLILDEYNRVQADETYDLAAPRPLGAFSPAFLRKVAQSIKALSAQHRVRAIVRR